MDSILRKGNLGIVKTKDSVLRQMSVSKKRG